MIRFQHIILPIICVMVAACGGIDASSVISGIEVSEVAPLPVSYYKLSNPGEKDPVLFTVSWSETGFYTSDGGIVSIAPVRYNVQIDLSGNDFENPVNIASTSSLSSDIKLQEFNLLLLDSLRMKAGENGAIQLRVLTTYGQNWKHSCPSSNYLELVFNPYQDRDPLQVIYLSGDYNSWSTNPTKMIPMFKHNSEKTNHLYTVTAWLPAGDFRIIPSDFDESGLTYCDKGDGLMEYVQAGRAFHIGTAGYYTLNVNLRNLTWELSPYDASSARTWTLLGFIGEFCSWADEPLMSRFSASNPHLWMLEYTLGELAGNDYHSVKFRAERSWQSRWAALDADSTPFGGTVYLEGDEADPNIVLREGGAYRIWFEDLTGLYIIHKL